MATYDVNGAKKGQAMNLAIADALKHGEELNAKYIYKKYVYYLQLAEIITGSDTDLIQQVIDSPDFDKVLVALKDVFNGDKK
jgi:hypothetical protein